jgi:hypothetical protein
LQDMQWPGTVLAAAPTQKSFSSSFGWQFCRSIG